MINCQQFAELSSGFACSREELSTEPEAAVHLEQCEVCRRKLDGQMMLREGIGRSISSVATPPGLREKVRAAIGDVVSAEEVAAVEPEPSRWRIFVPLGAVAAIALIVVASYLTAPEKAGRSQVEVTEWYPDPLLAEAAPKIVSAHSKCEKRGVHRFASFDTVSEDNIVHVAATLSKMCEVPVAAPDLLSEGLHLSGADYCYTGTGRQGAHFVYRRPGDAPVALSIYTLAEFDSMAPIPVSAKDYHLAARGDYNLLAWRRGQSHLVMVAKMEKRQLRGLARKVNESIYDESSCCVGR